MESAKVVVGEGGGKRGEEGARVNGRTRRVQERREVKEGGCAEVERNGG